MKVYFDNAATTKIDEKVFEAMVPYLKDLYYNPSSLYIEARQVEHQIFQSRKQVADLINATPEEIVFTGSGSESDNMAIKGVAFSRAHKGKHLITSQIEHHAVLDAFQWLETQGFEVTYLPVTKDGLVDPESVRSAIRKDTILISVMWVNNETGMINDMKRLSEIKNDYGILLHTDAVQALKTEVIDVKAFDIDLLSISAHKVNGPKGIGALYQKQTLDLVPLIHGGKQEFGKRAGTEAVASIIGFGEAATIHQQALTTTKAHMAKIKKEFINKISVLDDFVINGAQTNCSSAILNLGFAGIQSEPLLLHLNRSGICASMGASCNSKTIEPSYVLKAMAVPMVYINGCVRFSFGKYNTLEEVHYTAKELIRIVKRLRG